jgi:GH18 family chitinase
MRSREATPHELGMADVGERVRFLDKNGYDTELSVAREQMKEGDLFTVEAVSIGGWTSSYRFKETGGQYFNTVMFEPEQSA